MSTRVWESAAIAASADAAWASIRTLNFAKLTPSKVASSSYTDGSADQVGSLQTVTYKDGAVWTCKLLELSDMQRKVSWQVITAEPATGFTSRVDSLQVKRISTAASPLCYVEWTADFSCDADAGVTADCKFKIVESFDEMQATLGGGAGGGAAQLSDKEIQRQVTLREGDIPLDINAFREEKGGNPEILRESQRRRNPVDTPEDLTGSDAEKAAAIAEQTKKRDFAVGLVDSVIEADKTWRKAQYDLEQKKKATNAMSKEVGKLMKAKKREEAQGIMAAVKAGKAEMEAMKAAAATLEVKRDEFLCQIGNVVPSADRMVGDYKIPPPIVTHNEDLSEVMSEFMTAERRNQAGVNEEELLNHVDLFHRLDARDNEPGDSGGPAQGTRAAGGRAYYLKDMGVLLNQALIQHGLAFLRERDYCAMHTPFFVRQSQMGLCAQLDDFDEQLYKVTGEGEDKYLIATSEQALCCYHHNAQVEKSKLPLRYAGYSSCFRKEVGSHGRDTLGVFRVHQFEKVEQFVLTEPDKSWEMFLEMSQTSEAFLQSLGLPYKVINIVSGELNNAAAQKYDVEAWFPASRKYRELVSCSNCLDYQARRLNCRIQEPRNKGDKSKGKSAPKYVHMLNSTLTATERTMCCIVENYQTPEGVKVPEVLQKYMSGIDFMPFKQELPKAKGKKKKR